MENRPGPANPTAHSTGTAGADVIRLRLRVIARTAGNLGHGVRTALLDADPDLLQVSAASTVELQNVPRRRVRRRIGPRWR